MCHREVYRQLSLTNMREIFPLTSKLRTIMQLIGTRKQGFFRAGEFSWNESTLINILSTIHQKKASRENFLSSKCSYNCISNETFTHGRTQSVYLSLKLGNF